MILLRKIQLPETINLTIFNSSFLIKGDDRIGWPEGSHAPRGGRDESTEPPPTDPFDGIMEAYETKKSMTLVTELATGGDLIDILTRRTHVTESEIAILHSSGILIKKLENWLKIMTQK